MAEKECTAKQTGPGVTPGSGSKAPTQVKAPPSGAPSLKQPGNSKPVGNPKA